MLSHTIPLSGTDYFLHALDSTERRRGAPQYTCRFSLTFDRPIDLDQLNHLLHTNPGMLWLANARRTARLPFLLPRWVAKGARKLSVELHAGSPDSDWFNQPVCNDRNPFRVDYFEQTNQLYLSWLHTLMDAHGGEMVVKALANADILQRLSWLPPTEPAKALIPQLNHAKAAKAYLFEQAKGALLTGSRHHSSSVITRYHQLELTPEQTAQAAAACTRLGANFRKSCFYLAATARAFNDEFGPKDIPNGHILVPVPQDRRKRGGYGPVISNQVAFMFFRFEQSDLNDLAKMVKSASEQMMNQLRTGSLESCTEMMQLFRRLPLPIYRHLIKAPTKGHMASFYFSDTGASLDDLDRFMGANILDARHVPPNSYPPGLTVVFNMFRGSLRATISYCPSLFPPQRIDQFKQRLLSALVEGS